MSLRLHQRKLYFFKVSEGLQHLPLPPQDLRMQCLDGLDAVTKVRYEKKLSISNLPGYPYMYTTTIVAQPGSKLFFTSELFRLLFRF